MYLETPIEAGTELPPLAVPEISRGTLALFAGASGDHNPMHIDIDVAKSVGLTDVFAHGMLSMAYLGRLLTNCFPQESIRSYKARFVSITPVHAQPECTGVIKNIATVGNEQLATVELIVQLEDKSTTIIGEAVVALSIN
ncbi:MAG: MaoC/PaaZ C-terminal domain-containing protein [Mycobacteriaceae bacterium]